MVEEEEAKFDLLSLHLLSSTCSSEVKNIGRGSEEEESRLGKS